VVVLVVLLFIGLWLFCVLDVLGTSPDAVALMPKIVWLAVVLFLSPLGSVAWLMLGRPRRDDDDGGGESWREHPVFGGGDERTRRPWGDRPLWPPAARRAADSGDSDAAEPVRRRSRRARPTAPDDDPEFLRELSERIRRDGDNPRR
jgi:Phospholipase_D-nuclease N-terminal